MIGYIYITTNIKNNLIYIGKHEATSFEPQRYIGSGKLLKAAIKEFGKINFKCELLDTAETLEELWQKEQYWIKFYDAQNPNIGYNILKGGKGCADYQFTAEIRQKMSKTCTRNNLKRDKKIYKQVSNHHKGSRFMNNGEEQKWVYKDEVNEYLEQGWVFGACKKRAPGCITGEAWTEAHKNDARTNRVWVHQNNKMKWIKSELLEDYLKNGWSKGMKD